MLAMPNPTPYDLRFRLAGVPVRVTPWFWLIIGFMGFDRDKPQFTLVWIVCGFVSILVHEFGHALAFRWFGGRPQIALYGMGGLCSSDRPETPLQRVVISLAGPVAGFLIAGAIVVYLLNGGAPKSLGTSEILARLWEYGPAACLEQPRAELVLEIVQVLWFINLYWGLVNLLPILPLDGGQILSGLLTRFNPRDGARWACVVGLVTSGILAALAATRISSESALFQADPRFLAVFFAILAFMNYQLLQAFHQRFHGYGSNGPDWWKNG